MATPKPSLNIQQISGTAALSLWSVAKQASVFTNPPVLGALCHDVHWWLASESGRPAYLWPICLDARGYVLTPEFGYYIGPIDLMPETTSSRRRLLLALLIHQQMIQVLSSNYRHLTWSTFPGGIDLRPLLWSSSPGRELTLRPRYTAVINGLQSASDEDLLRRFGSDRRSLVRRAQRMNAIRMPAVPLARIQDLYCRTLAIHGAEDVALRRLDEIENLYRIVLSGHGLLIACGLADDARVQSVALLLFAKGRAYEVLAVSDEAWRKRGLNPFSRLQAFAAARSVGCNEYDFNGANSPLLALDKHSYGSEAQLYFDISF